LTRAERRQTEKPVVGQSRTRSGFGMKSRHHIPPCFFCDRTVYALGGKTERDRSCYLSIAK
jgi:hypothetical protein